MIEPHEILLVLRDNLGTLSSLQEKLFEKHEQTQNLFEKTMIAEELTRVNMQIDWLEEQIKQVELNH